MLQWLLRVLVVAYCVSLLSTFAHPQAIPTARRDGSGYGSFFVMGTNTKTGFLGSNDSITVGANIGLRNVFTLNPALEIRGTLPLVTGSSPSERNFLGGPVLRRRFGIVQPYANYLFGIGILKYPGTYTYDSNVYVRTASFLSSPGAGLNVFVRPNVSFKADIQWQNWNVPAIPSGKSTARSVSFGVDYRFELGHKKEEPNKDDPKWHKLHEDFPGLAK